MVAQRLWLVGIARPGVRGAPQRIGAERREQRLAVHCERIRLEVVVAIERRDQLAELRGLENRPEAARPGLLDVDGRVGAVEERQDEERRIRDDQRLRGVLQRIAETDQLPAVDHDRERFDRAELREQVHWPTRRRMVGRSGSWSNPPGKS